MAYHRLLLFEHHVAALLVQKFTITLWGSP